MTRIDCINSITKFASRFVLEVEGFNATGQYHINIHAENFLIPVLNEIFGLELENLNSTQKRNYPAIDLADFKNRVAFQISATVNLEKIKSTLQAFFEKGLDKSFDTLYFYFLTRKQDKYSDEKLRDLVPAEFNFKAAEHIIDKDCLLQRINFLSSTPKLVTIAKLYEHEFSDAQVETRKIEFEKGYLNNVPEDLFPNLLGLSFPNLLYSAEIDIDEEDITRKINSWLTQSGKKAVKNVRKGKLVNNALKEFKCYAKDWIIHENAIYTFRDLSFLSEPLRKVIDIGTITSLIAKEFYSVNENSIRVFKHLLRNTLQEYLIAKGIEWFGEKEIFRFANNQKMPNKKQVKWKGKNEATKTVIFEMINKKLGHIICFRSLAFRHSFENVGDEWFLCINPTWSFTDPYGYKISRFEPAYMAGIKRLENNGAIYNYFRFFGYHLTYTDLFTTDYPYLKIHKPIPLSFAPRLEDKTWKPAKVAESTVDSLSIPLEADNELTSNLF